MEEKDIDDNGIINIDNITDVYFYIFIIKINNIK